MTSLGVMIKRLGGMVGTLDLTGCENDFVENMVEKTDDGKDTLALSPRQVGWIEDLHARHFGGD